MSNVSPIVGSTCAAVASQSCPNLASYPELRSRSSTQEGAADCFEGVFHGDSSSKVCNAVPHVNSPARP